jgi:hypothetical protein
MTWFYYSRNIGAGSALFSGRQEALRARQIDRVIADGSLQGARLEWRAIGPDRGARAR